MNSKVNLLNQKTFKCERCGQCCRPIVKVSEEDIKKIEETGMKREDFLDHDPVIENSKEKDTIKQINGVCMFLESNENRFSCKIHQHRPETCRKYPFITGNEKLEDCKPPGWERWIEIGELFS